MFLAKKCVFCVEGCPHYPDLLFNRFFSLPRILPERWQMKMSQIFPKLVPSCFSQALGLLSVMVVSCGSRTFCNSKRGPLRAVQSACERHRNVRMLVLLDDLALVLLWTKGRTGVFSCACRHPSCFPNRILATCYSVILRC